NLTAQPAAGEEAIMGFMIESNLVAGKQAFPRPRDQLVYGQSITDACVDLPTTESMLRAIAGKPLKVPI
ncbi:MAG: hypothetical protein EA402_09660, partial [Planctomycetota bacterium]